MTNLEIALELVRAGGHVFPVRPEPTPEQVHARAVADALVRAAGHRPRKWDDKAPAGHLVKRGHHGAAADESQVFRWWGTASGTPSPLRVGLALKPSGLVALDVEGPSKTPAGVAWLREHAGELGRTTLQQTPSGGVHLLYSREDPAHARRLIRPGGRDGIDLLGDGYVVVYQPLDLTTTAALPDALAGWFAEAPAPKPRRERTAGADDGEPATPELLDEVTAHLLALGPSRLGEGGDQHLYRLAALARVNYNLTHEDALECLRRWNDAFDENHWDEDRLETKLDNAANYARGEVGDARDELEANKAFGAHLIEVGRQRAAPTDTEIRAALEALAKFRGSDEARVVRAAFAKKILKGDELDEKELEIATLIVREAAPGVLDDQIVRTLMASALTAERAAAAVDRAPVPDEEAGEWDTDPSGRRVASQANIDRALADMGVRLEWDEFADLGWLERDGIRQQFADHLLSALWLEVDERYNFRPTKDLFWTVAEDRARRNGYHPVREYLAGLEWDGVERIDRWLTTYCEAEDSPYTRAVGALPLIAAVRRVRQPGCKFDELLILENRTQGTGKSTAISILAVREEWFSDDLPLGVPGKVVIEQTAGRWIVECGELQKARGRDREDIKAFLSRRADVGRLAYGRTAARKPRSFVAIGTSNGVAFDDLTGARRFWPVEVGTVDLAALRQDRDQIWAEAAAREAAGVSIRLDESLWEVAAEAQAKRDSDNPFVETLAAWFGDESGWVSSDDLWKVLGIDGVQDRQRASRERRRALDALGWRRIQHVPKGTGKRTWGYAYGEKRQTLRPVPKRNNGFDVGWDIEIVDVKS